MQTKYTTKPDHPPKTPTPSFCELAEGPIRAHCPRCGHRYRWRDCWPVPIDFLAPYDRSPPPTAICPSCLQLVKIETEPLDERWWRWRQAAEVT